MTSVFETIKDSQIKPDQPEKPEKQKRFEKTFSEMSKLINAYFESPDISFTFLPGKGFYINLEDLVVNLDPEFMTKRGLEESEVLFGAFHEAEHFRDMMQNPEVYKKRQNRLKDLYNQDKKYTKELKDFHNVLDDVMVNMTVNGRWPAMRGKDVVKNAYSKLFPTSEYTKLPKQRQFSYALIRELMMPGEQCQIKPDVRKEVDRLKPVLTEISSFDMSKQQALYNPDTRIQYIEKLFEPVFNKFYQEAESSDQDDEKLGKGEKTDQPTQPADDAQPDAFDQVDPDDLLDQIEEINKKIKEKKDKKAKEIFGVNQEDLAEYQREFKQYVQPHLDGMVDFFKEFIQKRIVIERINKITSKGEVIAPHLLNEAYIKAKLGELDDAPVYLKKTIKEKFEEYFSDFEATLLIDGSGSMGKFELVKCRYQRYAVTLIMEAIVKFQDEVNELADSGEPIKMSLKTQIREFSDNDDLIKDFNQELDMMERVRIQKRLKNLSSGENNELASLQEVEQDLRAKLDDIIAGKLKKLIIITTDGETEAPMVQQKIAKLYKLANHVPNFKIIAFGIGAGTNQVADTYQPNGFPNINLDELAAKLAQELKEFIEFEIVE